MSAVSARRKKPSAAEAQAAISLPLGRILVGNCREVLRTLPAESVDVIFADPPYNLQLQRDLFRPNMTRVDAVDEAWDQFSSFAEYDQFSREWLVECRRVLKDRGTLWVIGTYHNIHRVGAILQDLEYWILNEVIWVKSNPMPNFRGVRFTNAHETLLWAARSRHDAHTFHHHALKALNDGQQMRSDWVLPVCSGKERIRVDGAKAHPTQKPEALLYRVLTASSRPGDVVLDPFFGTGTTGVVAKRLGRRWLGIERESGYAALAEARLASTAEGSGDVLEPADDRRRQPRLPFGRLLEEGLLQPGDRLYFDRDRARSAVVLADGLLKAGGALGSIHEVGRHFAGGNPCNGWEHWYYEVEGKGLNVINELRKLLREGEEAIGGNGELDAGHRPA